MAETNFNHISNRHIEWFEALDKLLLEQEEENARLHELVEENGINTALFTEEDLIYGWFRAFGEEL